MWIHSTKEFAELVRRKRKTLGLTQEELAVRCGVGVRFIVDLEAGKPSCQLGKALTVAAEVGLRLGDISIEKIAKASELPDRAPRIDAIGRKLEALGLADIATPREDKTAPARASTPTTPR